MDSEGTLEVSPDNLPWGPAVRCMSNTERDDEATHAICRHLGFEHGGVLLDQPIMQTSLTNTSNIHLSRVQCDQSTLDKCVFTPWNDKDCEVYQIIIIVCPIGKYIMCLTRTLHLPHSRVHKLC